MNTITGRSAPAAAPLGVQTLIDRQSSLCGGRPPVSGSCGQIGPNCVAWILPVARAFGIGGCQRFAPPVSSANGIPRKARTDMAPTVVPLPQTSPTLVDTGPTGQLGSTVGVNPTVAVGVAVPIAPVGVAVGRCLWPPPPQPASSTPTVRPRASTIWSARPERCADITILLRT